MLRVSVLLCGVWVLVLVGLLNAHRTPENPPLLGYVQAAPGTEGSIIMRAVPTDGSVRRVLQRHERPVCQLYGGPADYLLVTPVGQSERCTALDYQVQRWQLHSDTLSPASTVTRNELFTVDPRGVYVVRDSRLCAVGADPACMVFAGTPAVRWQSPSPQNPQQVALAAIFGGQSSLLVGRSGAIQVLQQTTPATSLAAIAPAWSPDGQQLAFFAQRRLNIYDFDSGQSRFVAEVPADPIVRALWSPNGDWLAWLGRTTTDNVYVTRLADGLTLDLSRSPAAQRGFAWVGDALVLADGGLLVRTPAPFTERTVLMPGHSPVVVSLPPASLTVGALTWRALLVVAVALVVMALWGRWP